MGRNPAALNEKQIAVLEWIKDSCGGLDEGADFSRRITARALHRRGLVVVKGRGDSWAASITRAGRAWLEKHPTTATEGGGGSDDLVRSVLAAGGRLEVGRDEAAKAAHEELVRLSHYAPNRPKGWRLEVKNAGTWNSPLYVVVLVRYFEDLVEELPVPAPVRVARYHPAVKAYLDDRDRQMVSKEHLVRAARILQAIADEAPKRGVEVVRPGRTGLPPLVVDTYRERQADQGHLTLRTTAGQYGIRIRELSGPGGKPQQRHYWGQRSNRARWLEDRDTEFVSTGVLELIVEGPGMAHNGYRPKDTSTITLEERLPRIFRKFEIHRLEAEFREQERARKAAERRRRWEAAMEEARARYDEDARWEAFAERSREWHDVRRHREFLAAAREAAALLESKARDELVAHLDFAERALDGRDPLADLGRLLPKVRTPKPDDLKPYLESWSPHGPEASW